MNNPILNDKKKYYDFIQYKQYLDVFAEQDCSLRRELEVPISRYDIAKTFFLDKKKEKIEKLRANTQDQRQVFSKSFSKTAEKSQDSIKIIDNSNCSFEKFELSNFKADDSNISREKIQADVINVSSYIRKNLIKNDLNSFSFNEVNKDSFIKLKNPILTNELLLRKTSSKKIEDNLNNSMILKSRIPSPFPKNNKEIKLLNQIHDNGMQNTTKSLVSESSMNKKSSMISTSNKKIQNEQTQESTLLTIDDEILKNCKLHTRKKKTEVEPAMGEITPCNPAILRQQILFCKKTGLVRKKISPLINSVTKPLVMYEKEDARSKSFSRIVQNDANKNNVSSIV